MVKPEDYEDGVQSLEFEIDRVLLFIKKKVKQKAELQEQESDLELN